VRCFKLQIVNLSSAFCHLSFFLSLYFLVSISLFFGRPRVSSYIFNFSFLIFNFYNPPYFPPLKRGEYKGGFSDFRPPTSDFCFLDSCFRRNDIRGRNDILSSLFPLSTFLFSFLYTLF